MIQELATHRRCVERIHSNWDAFLRKRAQRLEQQKRHGTAAEKVAENILEDLFTEVLDWSLSDVNNQVGYADLLISDCGIKYLIVEVKRPGSLAWNRKSVQTALEQAQRYADQQRVKCVAVSDGQMLYAADVRHGGLQDRVLTSLTSVDPPDCLWWLSVHGIYREPEEVTTAPQPTLPVAEETEPCPGDGSAELLHPKYGIPARCFGYVGHAADPRTWRLPYLRADGCVDEARLPKAIQAILSNYRGTKVTGIPEQDIPAVLRRLAEAAASIGKMPSQGSTAPVYHQLAEVLEQLEPRA
ncbi:MAG: hypothetical protein ABR978_03525 [Dehalococcoidia bacterium]|jgi:hypothetical protein